MNDQETIRPDPCEHLSEITADRMPALAAQVDALCDLMDVESRPDFDLERRMLLAIRRSVELLRCIG